jgi:DNA-binding CsgD family transcriptional regulator
VIQISPREQEVLDLMAEGYQDPAIAAALFISLGTVKGHKNALYQKLGAHNGAQAVHLAYQAGLRRRDATRGTWPLSGRPGRWRPADRRRIAPP